MDKGTQKAKLEEALIACAHRIYGKNNSSQTDDPSYCPGAWDAILCWDPAPPGTLQQQHCPDYIHLFNTSALATRYCTSNGTWFHHKDLNKSWTNYSQCHAFHPPEAHHAHRLKLIAAIGYSVSLCSLILAVIIMCCSRRLKSKSNTLHVNLFLAFILRAFINFLVRLLFVDDIGLEKDIIRTETGRIVFNKESSHFECRLLMTLFTYSICVSQIWIFVEGLYLHMLIYKTLSTERNGVRPYMLLGWVLPVLIMIPWILVKVLVDNNLCWNLTFQADLLWILNGPLLATVVLNFVFFLNISRVLCSRVRSNQRHTGGAKYRQLAKFILVLIPLFGVFYIALTLAFPLGYQNRFDLVPMYVEMTYNSFQGFLLALLFCFLNDEVHNEIKQIWKRRKSRRRDSAVTRSYAMSSVRRVSRQSRGQSVASAASQPLTSQHPVFSQSDSSGSEDYSWFFRIKRRAFRCLEADAFRASHRKESPNPQLAQMDSSFETSNWIANDVDARAEMADNTCEEESCSA